MSLPLIIMLVALVLLLIMGSEIGPAMIASGILYLLVSGQDPGLAAEAIMTNRLFRTILR